MKRYALAKGKFLHLSGILELFYIKDTKTKERSDCVSDIMKLDNYYLEHTRCYMLYDENAFENQNHLIREEILLEAEHDSGLNVHSIKTKLQNKFPEYFV